MSQRFVAIIDADLNLAGHLQAELSRYGLGVEISADSNELMARKDGLPDLVVLCIDPKRTGWAVCNRLRKSPLLKSVPLIITSAEATEKDFDDHKKLKTRAEEYLHKPFEAAALVDKIATLIGLPEQESAEVELEAEDVPVEIEAEEIGIEMAAEVDLAPEEEMTMGGREQPAASGFETAGEDESTRIGFTDEIDGEVDLETNAAFAAIGLDDPAEPASGAAEPESPFDDEAFGLPAVPEQPVAAAPPAPAPVAAAPASRPRPSEAAPADMESGPNPRLDADELGLEEVARDAAALVASTPPPRARTVSSSGVLEEAQRENDRLRKENEELRARPKAEPGATSSFSREREFLTLRETINKKEKEVLDLKDALDSKDRQILDGKEKLREAEKKLREGEERSLATERDLVAAREKVEALSADKERGVEREKQVKGRLEDAQKSLQRLEEEVEQWRGKYTSDTAALEEKHTQALARHRDEIAQLRQSHAASLADLKTELNAQRDAERQAADQEKTALLQNHAAANAQLRAQHEEGLAALRERHEQEQAQRAAEHRATLEAELKGAERRHAEALVDLEGKYEEAQQAMQAQHQQELRAQGEEARRTLEQAVADHLAERGRIEQDHVRAIETLDAKKTEELAAAAAQAAEDQAAALAQQLTEHEGQLKQLREQHARKLQALEESHDDLKAGMQARHATQLNDTRKQAAEAIAALEATVAERDQLIAQQRERQAEFEAALQEAQEQAQERTQHIARVEDELEAARTELGGRQKTLDERAGRISELEQESARYQDQILRAYQRIKSDENIVARAKKALAIALTLLEENEPAKPEEAKS